MKFILFNYGRKFPSIKITLDNYTYNFIEVLINNN